MSSTYLVTRCHFSVFLKDALDIKTRYEQLHCITAPEAEKPAFLPEKGNQIQCDKLLQY